MSTVQNLKESRGLKTMFIKRDTRPFIMVVLSLSLLVAVCTAVFLVGMLQQKKDVVVVVPHGIYEPFNIVNGQFDEMYLKQVAQLLAPLYLESSGGSPESEEGRREKVLYWTDPQDLTKIKRYFLEQEEYRRFGVSRVFKANEITVEAKSNKVYIKGVCVMSSLNFKADKIQSVVLELIFVNTPRGVKVSDFNEVIL
jgi:hypothetical protein